MIDKILTLLFDLIELKLYENRILKLEKRKRKYKIYFYRWRDR